MFGHGAAARSAAGSISIGLVDDGASADPRAGRYVVNAIAPGDEVDRTVRVSNETTEAVAIEVYVGGANVTDDGFELDDVAKDGLPSWATVDPGDLTVQPGDHADARVHFAIPDDATAGERYGVIWAQTRSAGGDSTELVNRVGVRVYLLVSEDGNGRSDLRVDTMTPSRDDEGAAIVTLGVTNTGDRAVDANGSLALHDDVHDIDPTGVVGGATLAPGRSGTIAVRLDGDVPNGPWSALATIDANGVQRRAEATIQFPAPPGETGDAAPATMVTDEPSKTTPAIAAAILIATITLLGIALVRSRAERSG